MTHSPLMYLHLVIVMCLGCVVAARMDLDTDDFFQIQAVPADISAEDSFSSQFDVPIDPAMDQNVPEPYRPSLIKLLLQNRDDLLQYIQNNRKVKRTRQCYWSAVSCF